MTETEAKWAERVREWKASGQTAKEFAAGRDFKASTLVYWASCLRTGGERRKKREKRGVRIARVVRVAPATDGAIVVAVGVARVSVRAGFDPEVLRQVVLALGERT